MDVRFHQPWSLQDFIAEQRTRVNQSSTEPSPDRPQNIEKTRLLRTLGFRVLSDINDVSVVMPTALIGTVLLTLRGRGVGKAELIRRVEWLSDRVRAKGGRVAHFAGAPTSLVVDRGLEVLGPSLVGTVEGLAETTYYAVDRFQLSFYRNMTIHLFVSESLVSAAMYTRVKQGGGPENQRISYDALYGQVSFLSQVCLSHSDRNTANPPSYSEASLSIPRLVSRRILRKLFKASKLMMSLPSPETRPGRAFPLSSVLQKEFVGGRILTFTVF